MMRYPPTEPTSDSALSHNRALPPRLMVSEPGSYAEYTIVQRKPEILAQVAARNSYPAPVLRALEAFADEIASGIVAPLREDLEDAAIWLGAWRPWEGSTWRQLPWYLAEAYFYRRLLEAVQYFQPGPLEHMDPFEPQKLDDLPKALDTLTALYRHIPNDNTDSQVFAFWLERSLWGNRADLSNLPVASGAHHTLLDNPERLLIDHTPQLWQSFRKGRVRRLDWVCDNSGLELLCDLALIDWLLSRDLVQVIRVHVKTQPFFVSDTMRKDLEATLMALELADPEVLRRLAGRLRRALDARRLVLHDDPFWTTHLTFRDWPEPLRQELGRADLLFFKGDVNYRRLLDDRHWPPTTDLAEVTSYVPTSFVAVRTLKGEIMVGLAEGEAECLSQQDPQWLINGERGLIHYVHKG